jgi:hypothetical protein
MISPRTSSPGSDGFTTIEVLIAMIIVTIRPGSHGQRHPAGVDDLGWGNIPTMDRFSKICRIVSFNSLTILNGFDSQNPATIPATDSHCHNR